MTLTEGTLQITFNGAIDARKFDDRTHGLSHCMKAVDFVVEFSKYYLFVEIKDPTSPEEYQRRLERRELDASLKYKFRDSFLYEWASGRAEKPIDYFVLITGIDKSLLTHRIDNLRRNIPVLGPRSQRWNKPLVRTVAIFNVQSWNRLHPDYPVTRRSSSSC